MNVFVNGGTRGIGKEIVLSLSEDAENMIYATGRNRSILRKMYDKAVNKNIRTLAVDLSVPDSLHLLLEDFMKENPCSIDILINNAGTLIKQDFMDYDPGEARKIMETNFTGPAEIIRILKPYMKKGSHIVNISSMGGFQGSSKFRGLSYYSASKAALACLSECLAVEFRESGIAVNCLAPGSVQTEMFTEAFPGYKAPVKPAEMAEFIIWFAKYGNKFFNGKVIPVALGNP